MTQKTEKQRRNAANNKKPRFDKKMKLGPDNPRKLSSVIQKELDKKLLIAAGRNWARQAKRLLGLGANMETTDVNGITPLMEAASHGSNGTCALLLEKGANANATDKEGKTPLAWAAYFGKTGICNMLLENGAGIDAKDATRGRTALIWAARKGFAETCAFLISRGADARTIDSTGMDALGHARRFNSPDLVGLLTKSRPHK